MNFFPDLGFCRPTNRLVETRAFSQSRGRQQLRMSAHARAFRVLLMQRVERASTASSALAVLLFLATLSANFASTSGRGLRFGSNERSACTHDQLTCKQAQALQFLQGFSAVDCAAVVEPINAQAMLCLRCLPHWLVMPGTNESHNPEHNVTISLQQVSSSAQLGLCL